MTGGSAGKSLDGRADLYAFGVVYLTLTGHWPFEVADANQWMQFQCVAEPPGKFRPEIADWGGLNELAVQLLQPDRERRVANASTVIRMIDSIDSRRVTLLGHNRFFAGILEEGRDAFRKKNYERVVSLVQSAGERASKLDASSMLTEAREALRLRDEASGKLQEARARRERAEANTSRLRQAIAKQEWSAVVQIMQASTKEDADTQILGQSSAELQQALWTSASAEVASAPAQLRSGFLTPASDALASLRLPLPVGFWSKLREARDHCLGGRFDEAVATTRSAAPLPGTVVDDMESAIRAWQASSARAKTMWRVAAGLALAFGFGLWLGSIVFAPSASTSTADTQAEIETYVAEREAWHADKGSDAELRKALELVKRWRARYPESKKLKDLEQTVQRRIDNPLGG